MFAETKVENQESEVRFVHDMEAFVLRLAFLKAYTLQVNYFLAILA